MAENDIYCRAFAHYVPLSLSRVRGERHNRARLNKPELWQSGADYLRNMRRDEVGIVALGHAGVGVAEVCRDHGQRCSSLQQVGGIGVA